MVDLDVLKAYKLDSESLKSVFDKPTFSELPEKIKPFVERVRERIQSGRNYNWENYRLYYALDLAWDSPFEQITPTLMASLIDKGHDDKYVLDQLKSWGMSYDQMIIEEPDPKTPGKNIRKLSVPAFFRIFVPLVRSYVTIRRAKLMNDRRLVPFFKFEPVMSDKVSRLRCAAITSRTETMAEQYGYYDVMNQAVFQELHYGECLQFPVEEWHTVKQIDAADSPSEGDEVEHDGAKYKEVIAQEGLRYHLPHPTRTFYDRGDRASTFNSDTGCSYAGYWRVVKYKDIMNNPSFWNLDKIGYDDFKGWMSGKSYDFFKNVLQGCAVDFPGCSNAAGVSKYDREKVEAGLYSTNLGDRPVVITEYFERLIPKENNLGDYPHPVWFRFIVAADSTIIYAAPLPYCPVVFYGYDAAENRTLNASMSLEILPFQDQFSNLLSQYLLTVKQNLTNISLIDTDILDEKDIKQKVENWGEKWFRTINVIRISFKKLLKAGHNPATAVVSHKFPIQDTTALLGAMRVILDTCERILAISNQELGQAASHEQTREEVRNITLSTATRVTFTGTSVDQARAAWKRQIYAGLMAYGAKSFYAQVPMDEEIPKEDLEKLGFTYATDSAFDPVNKRAQVKARDSTAISYQSFASDRDGDDRINDVETAKAMIGFFQQLIGNPMTMQAMGPEQAIKFANTIARFAGFPRDFKLVNNMPKQQPQDQQGAAIMQQVQQYIEQVRAAIVNDVKGALSRVMDDNGKQEQEIQSLSQQLHQIAQAVQMTNQPVPFPPAPNMYDQGAPQVPQPA